MLQLAALPLKMQSLWWMLGRISWSEHRNEGSVLDRLREDGTDKEGDTNKKGLRHELEVWLSRLLRRKKPITKAQRVQDAP